MIEPLSPDLYRPGLPRDRRRFGIAFVGCGWVVQRWQLPQYLAHGLRVEGVFDRDPEAVAAARAAAPGLRAYPGLDALLSDPAVDVVDIATTVGGRADLIVRALAAGKHVLAQKPLCLDAAELARIRAAAAAAGAPRLALNLNGRWSPQWRAARHLIASGAIGELMAVSHFHDFSMCWTPDVARHGSEHFLLFDYLTHWLDISQLWIGPRSRYDIWAHAVTRPADDGQVSQIGWVNMVADDKVCATIRSVAAGRRYVGHFFTVHGSQGALRGAVDAPADGDHLILEAPGGITRFDLQGSWFPDGFLGPIGDLLCAIEQDREPETGIASTALTQSLVFAACESARSRGARIEVRP